MSSSAQHHSTFCTLDELARPQIFSIASLLASDASWSLRFLESATIGDAFGCILAGGFSAHHRGRCRMNRLGLIFLGLALVSTAAWASQQGVAVGKNWKAMDQCTKEAQAAFPDFTADA